MRKILTNTWGVGLVLKKREDYWELRFAFWKWLWTWRTKSDETSSE